MSDSLAYAALAAAMTASGATNAYVQGTAANAALIAAVAAAAMAMGASQIAANALILTTDFNSPMDVLATLACAESLAQDTAALAEVVNVLAVVDPNQTAAASPVVTATSPSGVPFVNNPFAFGVSGFGVGAFD